MFKFLNGDFNVDGILGEFHSLIGRLESAVDFHQTQSQVHYTEAQKHELLAKTAVDEADRAQSVAHKLKELVG